MFTSEERRKYIGGSDIAAVMGMSRWKTPLKLWLEKTGEAEPDDLSKNEAVQLGSELEEFVAQKFARETGKQVRKQSKMYIHKDYPFMAAHIDRLITGADEILECKTCGSYKEDEWAEIVEIIEKDGIKEEKIIEKVPKEYLLQVIWYLGITGKKLAHIAVLIGGQKFKKRKIEFDEELFEVMVDMAKAFWNCVQTKTPPAVAPEDNTVLSEIFSNPNNELIQNQDIEKNIVKLQQIKDDISALTGEKDMLEAELKSIIGESLGVETEKFKVTWPKYQKIQINTKRLKDDGLYDSYVDKSSYRRLVVSEKKKAA
jgi:putative phage-type endonuclease